MAGRSGGMAVYAAISSILLVVLFVLTVVFYFQAQAADREVATLETGMSEFIRPDERSRDDVRQLVQSAAGERKSLVGYLVDSRRDVMRRVTGVGQDSLDQLNTKLDSVDGADRSALLQVARDAIRQNQQLQDRLNLAEAAAERAQQDAANETQRVASIESGFRETISQLSGEVAGYRDEVDSLRNEYGQARLNMDRRVSDIRTRADDRVSILGTQLDQARADLRTAEEQLREFRGLGRSTGVRPRPEESLVDGVVVAVNERDRQVTINLGSRDKVTLGMTFAAYSDAQEIAPGPDGNYPSGKANLEIIQVREDRSVARINGSVAGRPLLQGDVVANAVYDPNKVYKFVVYGFFDADGDGFETFGETRAIESAIRGWNGQVVDELAGDIDFVVLGTRPTLPPEPDITASTTQLQQFQEALTRVERYDNLFDSAVSAGVPVLNQNRFYTLIGKPLGDIR